MKGQLTKSDADALRLNKLGKLWSKPRLRLFLDHIVDMGPALLARKCGKAGKQPYVHTYARYTLTDTGRSVLRQYRARAACALVGSSDADGGCGAELLEMMPPLFVLEWEEMHGADLCREDGDEGKVEVCTLISRTLSLVVAPSLRSSLRGSLRVACSVVE